MKPTLGWTMLSREAVRQVERSLAANDQDTRDEIGFLLLHQGFADRFFPGTSVLQTRVRYALFIPWLYQRAARHRQRGSDLDTRIRRLLVELAIRLKTHGREPHDVIGGDKLGQLTSQPPDRVYWSAMRAWGLLLGEVDSRPEALRRLHLATRTAGLDDNGGLLNDEATEVFVTLPPMPPGWGDPQGPLNFTMPRPEREYLRRRLRLLTRSGSSQPALLARLVEADRAFSDPALRLPLDLDASADAEDKLALAVARDAAALAAIGRAVYGALVERLVARDGGTGDRTFRERLSTHFAEFGVAAGRCDLDAAEQLLPDLPPHVRAVLRETQAYVRAGNPRDFAILHDSYRTSEVRRKTSRRARLIEGEHAAQRRAEWKPERHNITPLHYRWRVVREMLADLRDKP